MIWRAGPEVCYLCASAQRSGIKTRYLECGHGICTILSPKSYVCHWVFNCLYSIESPPGLDRKLRKVTKLLGTNTGGENVRQSLELMTQTQPISTYLSVYWFWPTCTRSCITLIALRWSCYMDHSFNFCASAQRSRLKHMIWVRTWHSHHVRPEIVRLSLVLNGDGASI